jgi:PQQ-dependent dehydrogenase (methanol/ethanol family)
MSGYRRRIEAVALLLAVAGAALAQAPANPQLSSPVTDAMLANPAPQDWLMWRRTLDSWGYSPLKQIDTTNVHQLQLVWARGLEPGPQEGTPLVHDGVLYFPNPGDTIHALDAATGDLLWEHRRKLPEDINKFINAPLINRNMAMFGNLVIDTTADGSLYAVDARTGKDAWHTQVLAYTTGVHQTSGPLVAVGKVFSGRGCEPLSTSGPADCVITAHDALTGRELWRTRTIPGPGEPGDETWGDVPYAERKHVGAWMPPSYDPELKLLYIGTSVTSPAPKYLLGGNDKKHLYHNSTLALDPETGRIVWYYQHLVDHWDFDHPFERILIDTEVTPSKESVAWINPDIRPGEVHKVITGIPGKTGIVYTLDRRTGKFLWATPTIRQEAVESIDGKTGEVKVKPASLFQKKGDQSLLCPSMIGGKNWPAGAYSPLTKTMYFPLQNTCANITVVIDSRKERSSYGIRADAMITPGTTNLGSIHAINAVTGKTEWKFEQRAGTTSLVTTGGGLLFGGDAAGRFRAYDQRTGQILWQTNFGSQVTGFPISFAVGERQYIAVSTGSAVSTAGHLQLTPEIRPTTSNNLYVFALPEGWQTARTPPRPIAAPTALAATAPAAVPLACRRTEDHAPATGADPSLPDGRFSLAQVQQGKALYTAQQCVTCHGEGMRGTPGAPALADAGFRAAWKGRTVQSLLNCTRTTMPPGRQGALSDEEYLSLIAAMLDANGFKPGAGAGLKADTRALEGIVLGR